VYLPGSVDETDKFFALMVLPLAANLPAATVAISIFGILTDPSWSIEKETMSGDIINSFILGALKKKLCQATLLIRLWHLFGILALNYAL
jgi:hypothetical protein